MNRKLAQSILVQYCSDCKATNFFSDPSAESSYQKLIRLIRIKPCYKLEGIPTINIIDKIMKPNEIKDGISLRKFMLDAWKDNTKGMDHFKMISSQEKKYNEAKAWVDDFLEHAKQKHFTDEEVEAADTKEKRAELLKDLKEDDMLFREKEGKGMLVVEDWKDVVEGFDEKHAKAKMKSMLARIKEYEEGIDNKTAFASYRPCYVKHYIKFGNKNLREAEI